MQFRNYLNNTEFKQQNNTFSYQFNFNEFPSAIDIPYTITLGKIPPVIEVYIKRPDNLEFEIYSNSLDSNNIKNSANGYESNNNTYLTP